jgi:hypothetical protein
MDVNVGRHDMRIAAGAPPPTFLVPFAVGRRHDWKEKVVTKKRPSA